MKNIANTALLAFLCLNLSAETVKDTAIVLFETDSHRLTPEAKVVLTRIITVLPRGADAEWVIHGHTDSRGSVTYNNILSHKRAQRVRNFLVVQGVDKAMITMDYHGEMLPLRPNTSRENLQLNRRVELSLRWYRFDDVGELESELRSGDEQVFVIQPGRDTMIGGTEGTCVHVRKRSFIDQQGNPIDEPVTVVLTEAISMANFIMNGLSTKSGDRILQSGGMIRLDATTESGETVAIDPSQPLGVVIPATSRQRGMQVFTSQDGQDWGDPVSKVFDSINYSIPLRPAYQRVEYDLPKYQPDLASKPRRPVPPSRYKMPREPRRASYVPKERWYGRITSSSRMEFFEKEYEKAFAEYLRKRAEYEDSKSRYSRDSIQYLKDRKYYQHNLALWKQKTAEEEDEFMKSPEYLRVLRKQDSADRVASIDYIERLKKWRKVRNERKAKAIERMAAMGYNSQTMLEQYMFSTSELSWINVDRFYKQNMNETREVVVADRDTLPEKVFIVFREMNSLLPMYRSDDGGYSQSNIPENIPAEIFAYKVRDGQVYMYRAPLAGSGVIEPLFEPCTFAEISAAMAELNG